MDEIQIDEEPVDPARRRQRAISLAVGAAVVAVLLLMLGLSDVSLLGGRDSSTTDVGGDPSDRGSHGQTLVADTDDADGDDREGDDREGDDRDGSGDERGAGDTPAGSPTTSASGGADAGSGDGGSDPAPGNGSGNGGGGSGGGSGTGTGTATTVPGVDVPTTAPDLPEVTVPSLPVPTTLPPLPEIDLDATLELSDSHISVTSYVLGSADAPRLVWSATAAVGVTVQGTNLLSAALNGNSALCPGTTLLGLCVPALGTHTFELRATDGAGNEVVRTASLTVG